MANGHVEIHDPFTNNNVATDPNSQTADLDTTVEFRLLMVYNQRRHPIRVPDGAIHGQMAPPTPETDMEVKPKPKKKRRGMKSVFGMCSCMRPQMKTVDLSDREETNFRSGNFPVGEFWKQNFFFRLLLPSDLNSRSCLSDVSEEEKDELDEAAGKLTEIADDIPFIPPDIETDSAGERSPDWSLWQRGRMESRSPVVRQLFLMLPADIAEIFDFTWPILEADPESPWRRWRRSEEVWPEL